MAMREDSQLPLPASDNRSFSAMFADDEGDARMPPVRQNASFSMMRADDDGHTVMPPVRQNGSFSAMFGGDDSEDRLPAIARGDHTSASLLRDSLAQLNQSSRGNAPNPLGQFGISQGQSMYGIVQTDRLPQGDRLPDMMIPQSLLDAQWRSHRAPNLRSVRKPSVLPVTPTPAFDSPTLVISPAAESAAKRFNLAFDLHWNWNCVTLQAIYTHCQDFMFQTWKEATGVGVGCEDLLNGSGISDPVLLNFIKSVIAQADLVNDCPCPLLPDASGGVTHDFPCEMACLIQYIQDNAKYIIKDYAANAFASSKFPPNGPIFHLIFDAFAAMDNADATDIILELFDLTIDGKKGCNYQDIVNLSSAWKSMFAAKLQAFLGLENKFVLSKGDKVIATANRMRLIIAMLILNGCGTVVNDLLGQPGPVLVDGGTPKQRCAWAKKEVEDQLGGSPSESGVIFGADDLADLLLLWKSNLWPGQVGCA